MLLEIDVKGGLDSSTYSDSGRVQDQKIKGRTILSDGRKVDKDFNGQDVMSVQQFVPSIGYAPIRLIHRGINVVRESMRLKTGIGRPMLQKRPHYVLDTKLEALTDEYFRDVIRPRQLLIDSEDIALRQLKHSAGISTQTLHQVPMIDRHQDIAFKVLQAQMTSAMYRGSGQGSINKNLPVEKPEDADPNREHQVPINQYPNYVPSQTEPIRIPGSLPVGHQGERATYDSYLAELRIRQWLQANRLVGSAQHMEWLHAQRYDLGKDLETLGLRPTFQALQDLPGFNGLPNIYGLREDDDVDIRKISGLLSSEYKKLKSWMRDNLGWQEGQTVKRSQINPILVTLASFRRLLLQNKVKLLGAAGVAGVALAYGMNPQVGNDIINMGYDMGNQGVGFLQSLAAGWGQGQGDGLFGEGEFKLGKDDFRYGRDSATLEDIQKVLQRAGFKDTEYFGEDKRDWINFIYDWAQPSMQGANVKLAAGIFSDPIAHDLIT